MLLLAAPQRPLLAHAPDDARLLARIRAEFREMPGLTLTLPQAARLFNIDPVGCARVLDALVAEGFLATNGRTFARAHGGPRSA